MVSLREDIKGASRAAVEKAVRGFEGKVSPELVGTFFAWPNGDYFTSGGPVGSIAGREYFKTIMAGGAGLVIAHKAAEAIMKLNVTNADKDGYKGIDALVAVLIVILVVGVGLAIILSLFIARAIVEPIALVTRGAGCLAEGDLSGSRLDMARVNKVAFRGDEVGGLTRSLLGLSGRLGQVIGGVNESSSPTSARPLTSSRRSPPPPASSPPGPAR